MTTLQFITAMVIIALIAGVAYFRYKKEKNGNSDALRFPSGKPVPKDTHLLKFDIPELNCLSLRDSFWLSEYVRKKILVCTSEEERLAWEDLYDRINDVCFGQF